jgi:hypothetical protein
MKSLKGGIGAFVVIGLAVTVAAYLSPDFRVFLKWNWGSLASVAGLGLSFLAALFSAKASKAAREARDALLARTLEQEINEAYRLVSDLITLVETNQFQVAMRQCSELLDVPTRIRIRWDGELQSTSKDNLTLARGQLEGIHAVLRKSTPPLGQREADRLLKACIEVRTLFVEEQALIMRDADRGENGTRR